MLVDSHIHIHDCLDLPAVLDSALHNFHQVALRSRQLFNLRGGSVLPTYETDALPLIHVSGEPLLMISGRQIISRENRIR